MTDVVLVERQGRIATVTLNRPEKRNALNAALRTALANAFAELNRDDDVSVVILTGSGPAFCAGLDLKELGGESPGGGPLTEVVTGGALLASMQLRKPVIGAINGLAITGGFELALSCDLLIASEQARFADTHARVGVLPSWGLSQRLSRLIGIYRAKELSLTGNYIDAHTAERWGLVNRVVPAQDLLPTCHALANDMLSCDPITLRSYKQVIDEGFAKDFSEGLELELAFSRKHADAMQPEDVAARRAAVQERGRVQKD
ncbi:MAG TPA: enoyl-CoA hydratase [Polyangiales bacterium]